MSVAPQVFWPHVLNDLKALEPGPPPPALNEYITGLDLISQREATDMSRSISLKDVEMIIRYAHEARKSGILNKHHAKNGLMRCTELFYTSAAAIDAPSCARISVQEILNSVGNG